MREFVDEVGVLSRWLGRDVAAQRSGGIPAWSAFRFRDAAVFAADESECGGRMYLVRGATVRELIVSQMTIDEAYAGLSEGGAQPAVA